jgi:hypothetical protein
MHDALADLGMLPPGCPDTIKRDIRMLHGKSVVVARRVRQPGDSLAYDQRAAIELSDGRLVVATLSGRGEASIPEQQAVFNAIVDSITALTNHQGSPA